MDASRRPLATAVAAVALLAGAAAPAAAQDPVIPPPPAPPAPAPPAAGTLTLKAPTGAKAEGKALALAGDKLTATGTLKPFVAGQRVVVRLYRGRKPAGRKVVRVKPAANGTGAYTARLRLKRTGPTVVRAFHKATPELARTEAPPARVRVVTPALGHGSSGLLVKLFQRRLRQLRFAVAKTGVYDDRTARAVIAWRKIQGMARLGTADATVVRKVLARKGGWKVRHPKAGRHVEADVSQGVLALVKGDRVIKTFHTSPGKPSTPTIIGRFRFYLKTIGTNGVGMVDSSYFIRGYAIHGYHSVPVFNASHGCLRIPIPDARYVYNWVRVGDLIFVEP